ncbi:MAG: winged helix-turn-helix domain-containing protein [Gammaproteobacteria bacterium]
MGNKPKPKTKIYRFGRFTVDIGRACLLRGEERVELRPKSFDTLVFLLDNPGRLVTKDELIEAVWPTSVVSDGSLGKCIQDVRQAIGDDEHELIRTVPRRGYILEGTEVIAEDLDDEASPLEAPSAVIASSSQARSRPRTWPLTLFGAAATLLILVGGAAMVLSVDRVTAPVTQSVAVLPLQNLSSEPGTENFASGLHDSILNQLVKISGLKTIARTSMMGYANTTKSISAIARELNVDAVMEGSIQYADGRVLIIAQLINPENDLHLWSEEYDRPLTARNLFDIQNEISIAIAETLQATLSPDEFTRVSEIPTENTRAYEFYVSGLGYAQTRDNDESAMWLATQQFEKAVQEDPEFALAWVQLSRMYTTIFNNPDPSDARQQLALNAVQRAFELAPNLPEAHLALGFYHLSINDDVERAIEEYEIAERGLGDDASLYRMRLGLYRRMGNWNLALENWERAIELDPRNQDLLAFGVISFEVMRDYARAEQVLERILEFSPDDPFAHRRLPIIHIRRGDRLSIDQARAYTATLNERNPWWVWWAALLAEDYDTALAELDAWRVSENESAVSYGWTHLLAGNRAIGRSYLERARNYYQHRFDEDRLPRREQTTLAHILVELGEIETGLNIAREALSAVPPQEHAVTRTHVHLGAIEAYVAADEVEPALDELDAYLSEPGYWSIEGLVHNPFLKPIHDHPRFQELIEKYSGG